MRRLGSRGSSAAGSSGRGGRGCRRVRVTSGGTATGILGSLAGRRADALKGRRWDGRGTRKSGTVRGPWLVMFKARIKGEGLHGRGIVSGDVGELVRLTMLADKT